MGLILNRRHAYRLPATISPFHSSIAARFVSGKILAGLLEGGPKCHRRIIRKEPLLRAQEGDLFGDFAQWGVLRRSN